MAGNLAPGRLAGMARGRVRAGTVIAALAATLAGCGGGDDAAPATAPNDTTIKTPPPAGAGGPRVLLVGVDGATYARVQGALLRRDLPNLARLNLVPTATGRSATSSRSRWRRRCSMVWPRTSASTASRSPTRRTPPRSARGWQALTAARWLPTTSAASRCSWTRVSTATGWRTTLPISRRARSSPSASGSAPTAARATAPASPSCPTRATSRAATPALPSRCSAAARSDSTWAAASATTSTTS
ncbi:hypothetical protein CNECB9_2770043 [Cupriavidus necator]|uniref:Uncharacterized protein n=1 Tax=Cupriavidus necator TaxID=106590 RepID=A0A1K0IFL2_CUPNE|nr:hypothetical protein CNECB9_2770043 [Cupriavidus necator]